MAVRIAASPDQLVRTTGLPAFGSVTASMWFYRVVDTGGDEVLWYWGADTGFSSNYFGGYIGGADQITPDYSIGGTPDIGATLLATGTWYRYAVVFDNAADTITYYLNGAEEAQITGATGSFTPGAESFGSFGGGALFNGRVAALKTWTAALTLPELQLEWRQYLPERTANLHRVTPLLRHTDLVDYGGVVGVPWTAGGTLTTEDGPPIPWRQGRRRVLRPLAAVTLPDLSVSLDEPAISISTF